MLRPVVPAWQDRTSWLVIALGVVLLLLPHRLRLRSAQPIQTALLAPLRLGASLGRALSDAKAENERLSLLAVRLSVENARHTAASHADDAEPSASVNLIRSPVIGRDLTTFEHWLTISRGSRQGVRPGAPVITPDGVCGKVVACGQHQSLVKTLLAPESRIAVVNARSRVPALARPDRSGRLVLDYAPKDSDFRPGDTVVTAGIGTVFPKGLRLGEVADLPDRQGAMFKSVSIRPFADIGRVEQVFVMSLPDSALPDSGAMWLENTTPPEISVPGYPANQ